MKLPGSEITKENLTKLWYLMQHTRSIMQSEDMHPEGFVWEHAAQAFHNAMVECTCPDLVVAAWVHDIGKQAYLRDHVEVGIKLLDGLVSEKTMFLVANHMRIKTWLLGEMHEDKKPTELATHPWLPELVHLCRIDMLSRTKKTAESVIDLQMIARGLKIKSMQTARIGKEGP